MKLFLALALLGLLLPVTLALVPADVAAPAFEETANCFEIELLVISGGPSETHFVFIEEAVGPWMIFFAEEDGGGSYKGCEFLGDIQRGWGPYVGDVGEEIDTDFLQTNGYGHLQVLSETQTSNDAAIFAP